MLDNATRELVKATVPVLQQHGVTLTRHFYARMFAHHPELMPVFNQTSQKTGSQQQALAMAVLAYAEHIDHPEVLLPVLKLIANKHVSLGIRAEHYAIVGKHLLASIKEVLGDASSDALINAWAAAYTQLADILIAQEQQLYQHAVNQEGGWSGWRSFIVEKKIKESDEITSFYLKPRDGGKVPLYAAGQYISVKLPVPSMEMTQIRQYSLSAAPGKATLRISVKNERGTTSRPRGVVSSVLHDSVEEGHLIDVAPPMGDYYLHEDRDTPVVLISAGVGITPHWAMLERLIETRSPRQILLIHACRHGGVHGFKQQLQQWRQAPIASCVLNTIVYYEKPRDSDRLASDYDRSGRLQLDELASSHLPPDADYYLCGPVAFMQEQIGNLKRLGIDPLKIHSEAFGSGGVVA